MKPYNQSILWETHKFVYFVNRSTVLDECLQTFQFSLRRRSVNRTLVIVFTTG